ncbi:MAG TPA: beta-ketoacyl synthase N-terminal-like domain-containing protein, partial [Pseudomonadales bacterium]|nr:beta-ketoacyl synthase N-terminal-like domain-containing protein [Pseudomonadales bacterium]
SEEQLSSLDLSSWEIAFNGAEPIRAGTLDRFAEKFGQCGFNRNALYTCYGLAEATLFVTGSIKGQFPSQINVDAPALAKNVLLEVDPAQSTAKTLVSSGYVVEQDVRIVHPDSMLPCSEFEAGEIWVKGQSVAQGYWNRAEATQETFQAFVKDSQDGPYLRTGDIGFLFKNQLYVTGRIKELVIVDGRNHYPQDIEDSIQSAHESLRRGCGAAFSVDVSGQEKLVIVQELERRREEQDLAVLAQQVRKTVAENHDVQLHAMVFIEYGSLLKTSSGKIRRGAMRDLYLNNGLKEVFRSELAIETVVAASTERAAVPETLEKAAVSKPESELRKKILELLSPHVGLAAHQIDVSLPFSHFGLDSRALVGLSGELEEKLGRRLSPHLFYNYPTVAALTAYLEGESKETAPANTSSVRFGDDSIAIVGMACRFPGEANSPERFWQLLLNHVDAISEVPEDRWNKEAYFDPDPTQPGKMNTKWGGFLADVARFDAAFFGVSPREAVYIDPQQRLLLETSWEALENALIVPNTLAGSQTGVFIGVSSNDYGRLMPRVSSAYAGAGNAFSIAANRISYFYDWHGPSVVVDTACSSSLVAVHQACNSLLMGECDTALAGAANLILAPEVTVSFSQNRMMAADGRCKTFDDSADGYVRSEGVGVLVLKRLSDAERDGDNIVAVIRGSAVNQDGKTNGLTAPNGRAQEAVIKAALASAKCKPEQVQYVECHGTGTRLGDPIEVYALQAAYGQRAPDKPLLLGAVKSNIGHLEAAAGLAGVIKAALSLQKGIVPANLHCDTPNSQIEWEKMALTPVLQNTLLADLEWAGVSSFGFGGTNAHLILQRYARKQNDISDGEWGLLTLSGRDEAALKRQIQSYHAYLTAADDAWAEICAASNLGRQHFSERAAVVADSASAAAEVLNQKALRPLLKARQKQRKIAFMFTGQGSQYLNMGKALYERNALFRDTLRHISELSKKELEYPLISVLYPEAGNAEQMEQLISRTDYTQPALFAIEYALAQLWLKAGVVPQAVLGHSLGEFTAACVAGVFSLEDAFKLVCARGRLMQSLEDPGAMMAVFAHENDVREYLELYADQVSIGAFNGPGQIVLSGKQKALQLLAQEFEKRGIQTKVLRVSHGFHSPLMQPMMQAFSQVAQKITYSLPAIPILSNVTGRLENKIVANPGYWCAHVLSPVHFSQSMQTVEKEAFNIVIEVGPKPTLIGMGKRCLPAADIVWLPSMDESNQGWRTFLNSVAQAYCDGVAIEFSGLNLRSDKPAANLPNYAFSDTRFWLESGVETSIESGLKSSQVRTRGHHPLLGRRLYSPRMKESEYL